MKKTIGLIFFGCIFILCIRPTFDRLVVYSIKYYLNNKMGSKCLYDKIVKQKKGWSFYNLKVSRSKLFELYSEKLDFFIDFDWRTFKFSYRVKTDRPKLRLQKIAELPNFSSSKNSTFNITKLELSIEGEENSFFIDLVQNSPKETSIEIFSEEDQETANLEISYIKANVSYVNLSFNNLKINEYLKLLKLFTNDDNLDCMGVINGDLTIQKKNEIDHFFSNLKLEDISFNSKNIFFTAPSANVELEYPASISLKKAKNKEGLEKSLDVRSKIIFHGLSIKPVDGISECSLTDLDGFFSYNPLIGPKWNIKGKACVDGILEEILLEGKGFLNSLRNSWIEGKVCFDKSKLAIFKISDLNNLIRSCYFKIDHFTEKQFQLFQEFSARVYPDLRNFRLSKVDAFLECNIKSNFNDILEFDVVDCGLQDLKITLNQKVKGLSIQEFKFKGNFNSSFDKSLTGIGRISGGEVISSDPKYSIEKIFGQLELNRGTFINSQLHLSINGINAEVSLNEEIKKVALIGRATGKVDSLIDFLPHKKNILKGFKSKLFESEITFKKGKKSEFYGTLQMLEEVDNNLQFSAVFQDQYLKKISHGWIKGENISLNNLCLEQVQLSGKASFTASFEDEKISFLVKGKNLRGESDYFLFSSDYIGGEKLDSFESVKCLQGSFDQNSSEFHIFTPIENCLVRLKKYKLEFSDIKGSVEANNDYINLQLNSAKSCDVNFSGGVLLHKSESNEFDVSVSTDKVYGKIENLISLLSHFNPSINNLENLSGSFESLENGFEFQYRQSKIFWRFLATIDKAKYDAFDRLSLDQMKGEIELDSKGKAKLKDILGELKTVGEGHSYEVYIPLFSKENKKVEFDFRISNDLRDIIRLVGNASNENDQYNVKLDDNLSHIFSSKLAVDNLFIRNKEIQSFSLVSIISLRNTSLALNFFKKVINVPSLDKAAFPDSILINGEMSYKLDYKKNNESSVEISGKGLKYDHFSVQNFDLKAKFKGNNISVSELDVNDIKSSFSCSILDDHLEFRDVSAKLKDSVLLNMEFDLHSTLQVNGYLNQVELDASVLDWMAEKKLNLVGKVIGKGRFSIDLPNSSQKLQIESDLNVQTSNLLFHDFSFDCKNSVRAYFSYSEGWILDGLSFDVVNVDKNISCLSCKIGKLLYRPSEMKYVYEDAHLYFFEDLFNKVNWQSKFVSNQEFMKIGKKVLSNKEICAFGEFDIETSKLACNVKEHQVDYHDTPYLFRNIQVNITPESLVINSKYISSLFEFPLDFKIYYDESVHGRLILKEENESRPMRVEFDFKNGFQIHSIVGRFHGVSARVQRDENADFIASVKCDFRKIKDYIYPMIAEFFDELDMGDGYEFRGKVLPSNNDFQFKGTFTGKDIELGGFVYQTLMSDILIDSKSVEITDLKVSDKSGIFKINKLDIFKEKDKWSFAIPEFKIIEFRPSLLQKIGKPKDEIKPLVFREIVLIDISGKLEDKKTYKGHGSLSFINSFKRDHSVFDVPADFFGRIFGLDLELLIPVKGMVDLELKDGKIYFSNLENAFSEGNRSKFFLASKAFPHTLDLNGELDIHIQMKHYVLFTFTESFILSLEGNLSDPKFGLKKKKTLFSK